MFEASLKTLVKTVFQIERVTFDLASESKEQECIFIEVDSARPTIKDGHQYCRVTGKLRLFANSDKVPYGYMMKKLRDASSDMTRDIFFFDFETNVGTINNVVERSMSFEYFYDSQYDPSLGSITSIDIEGGYE
jgi:hypothetical protein